MPHIWENNDLKELWLALTNGSSGQTPIVTTIDITGLTVIDMTNVEYADIVNLMSTNGSETIHRVINDFSNKPIIFLPKTGLSIEFRNKSVLSPNSNLRLYAAAQIANGTKQGFIELRKRVVGTSTDFYETNFMDEYYV